MFRAPTYPLPHCNTQLRAIELWFILQHTIQTHCKEITTKELDKYISVFDAYWNACEALGMHVGSNHPLDLLGLSLPNEDPT